MVDSSTGVWDSLEDYSSTLFIAAGVVLIVYVGLLGYQAFIDSTMNFHDNEASVVGPAGFCLGAIGLLGLYPAVRDRSPKVAGAGAVVAALGAVGWFVIAASGLADLAGIEAPAWLQAVGFAAFLEMLVGFPLLGIASLRTDAHSRLLGLLLMAPAIIFGAMIASGALTGGSGMGAVIISSGLTMVHLGVGYLLRAGGAPADHAEPAAETAP